MLKFLLNKVQAKIYVCKTLLKFNLCFHEPFIQFLYNLFSSMLKIQAVPSLQKYLTSTTQGPLCYAVFGCGKGCYLVKLCNDIWQYTDFSHVLHLKMISLEISSFSEIQGFGVPSNFGLDITTIENCSI